MSLQIIFLIVIAVVIAIGLIFVRKGKEIYTDRPCQDKQWRRQFPSASKKDIRSFLHLFSSAFAINGNNELLLSPQDELLEIYRGRYPSRANPDVLEFETLSDEINKEYGLSLQRVWHNHLNLGELFSMSIAAQQGTPVDRP